MDDRKAHRCQLIPFLTALTLVLPLAAFGGEHDSNLFDPWNEYERTQQSAWEEYAQAQSPKEFQRLSADEKLRLTLDFEREEIRVEIIPSARVQKAELEREAAALFRELKINPGEVPAIKQAPAPSQTLSVKTIPLRSGFLLRRAQDYLPLVEREARRHHLPVALVLGLIREESAFNPRAFSSVGAVGLMQVLPRGAGIEVHRWRTGEEKIPSVDALMDPAQNISYGCEYLAHLLQKKLAYLDRAEHREVVALAGYNWGPDRAQRALKAVIATTGTLPTELGPVFLPRTPRETQTYVVRVLASRTWFEAQLAPKAQER